VRYLKVISARRSLIPNGGSCRSTRRSECMRGTAVITRSIFVVQSESVDRDPGSDFLYTDKIDKPLIGIRAQQSHAHAVADVQPFLSSRDTAFDERSP
jgi:hypothetical protein